MQGSESSHLLIYCTRFDSMIIKCFVNMGYRYVRVRTLELVVDNLNGAAGTVDRREEGICIDGCGIPLLLPLHLADHHAFLGRYARTNLRPGRRLFRVTTRSRKPTELSIVQKRNPLLTFAHSNLSWAESHQYGRRVCCFETGRRCCSGRAEEERSEVNMTIVCSKGWPPLVLPESISLSIASRSL